MRKGVDLEWFGRSWSYAEVMRTEGGFCPGGITSGLVEEVKRTMLSRVNEKKSAELTVRELEELLERKKGNVTIAELLKERDRLRLEIRRIDDQIELIERSDPGGGAKPRQAASQMDESLSSTISARGVAEEGAAYSFLAGKRKNNLKDYIAQVLLQSRGPLSASEIQRELPGVGYMSVSYTHLTLPPSDLV